MKQGIERTVQNRLKGRPLLMLALLLSLWMGTRLAIWESPFPSVEAIEQSSAQLLTSQTDAKQEYVDDSAKQATQAYGLATTRDNGLLWSGTTPSLAAPDAVPPLLAVDQPAPELAPRGETAAAHQLVWLAAMAHLPVPQVINDRLPQPVHPTKPVLGVNPDTDRWSLDTWAFWRDGSNSSLIAAGRVPTYGASQAGAVLNYRLAPENGRDPRAYMRVYRALVADGEAEIAGGVSARPFANLPLRAHAELRVTELASTTEIRPAAFVTTELQRMALPLRFHAEAYAQAGYVGGKAATGFADGQIHLVREVEKFDLGSLSVGAAAWAGAQEGAQRLDLGPSLRADMRIGDIPARVSVDYRERVAGDAEPPSGVAVTLSTRF